MKLRLWQYERSQDCRPLTLAETDMLEMENLRQLLPTPNHQIISPIDAGRTRTRESALPKAGPS